jgi:large subunit ribosomal protein L25
MVQNKMELSAKKRVQLGKKNKQLRKANQLPGNIFGNIAQPTPVVVNLREFQKTYEEAGESSVVYLNIEAEEKNHPVLISEVQMHPLSGLPLHVSFREVNLREKVTAEVEVELIGELTIGEATAVLVKNTFSVDALPTDLPESFSIELSKFTEIGQEVTVADLEFDRTKVSIDAEPDEVVLQIQAAEQMAEEVVETPAEAPAEGETPAEASTAEAASSKEETSEKKE